MIYPRIAGAVSLEEFQRRFWGSPSPPERRQPSVDWQRFAQEMRLRGRELSGTQMSILEKHPAAAQRIQQGLAIDAKRIEYYVNGRLLLGVDLERQQYRLVSDSELERTFHGPVQLVEMYCNGVLVYLEIGEEQIFAAPNLDAIDELLPYYLCYQLNWTRHL